MTAEFTVILNNVEHCRVYTEEEAVRIADEIFDSSNAQCCVIVQKNGKTIFELNTEE